MLYRSGLRVVKHRLESKVEAELILALGATPAPDNTVNMLSAGLRVLPSSPTPPHAVVIRLDVPWPEVGSAHSWRLVLIDAGGSPVVGPKGNLVSNTEGRFGTQRPIGVILGEATVAFVVVTVGPLPLEAGQRYGWRFYVDGETRLHWETPFMVAPARAIPLAG